MRLMVWLGLFLVLAVSTAQAGGPPESLVQAVVDPSNPDHIVVRYENAGDGLVVTEDGGETWRALCTAAVKPPEVARLDGLDRIGIAGDGVLHVGRYDGLARDDGTGCGFGTEASLEGQWVSDFANHPADPDVLFAVTSTAPNGENGVFMRDGSGTWAAMGAQDDSLLGRVHAVELPSGGLRFYQSASRGVIIGADGMSNWANYMIRVSDDMGATWTEHLYDVGEPDVRFYLVAVDPTDPDRILVAIHRLGQQGGREGLVDELIVSEDRGATFSSYLTVTQFGDASIAADGRIWIGDQGDPADLDQPYGLFFASSLAETPTKIDDSRQITCVTHLASNDKVLACGRIEAGFYAADGTGYETTFTFADASAMVSCDGVDMAGVCEQQFTRYWCTAAHFNDAPLCCPYVDADGNLVGTKPDNLDCSGWQDPNAPAMPGDAGTVTTGDGDMMGTTGDGDMPDATGDGDMPGDGAVNPMLDPSADESDGCGCAVPGRPSTGLSSLWPLLGLLVVARLRRWR